MFHSGLFKILLDLKAQFQGRHLQEALPGEGLCSVQALGSPYCYRHRICGPHDRVCEKQRPLCLCMQAVRVVMGSWLWDEASLDLVSSSKAVWRDACPCPRSSCPVPVREHIWIFTL